MTESPDHTDVDQGAIDLAHRVFDFARNGETDLLAAHLDAGVPIELTDAAGNTLVMLAAYHGHAPTVAALTERGAKVDALNDRGQSPLAGALFKGEEEVVRLLVAAGADLDAGSPTARQTAEMFGQATLLN